MPFILQIDEKLFSIDKETLVNFSLGKETFYE